MSVAGQRDLADLVVGGASDGIGPPAIVAQARAARTSVARRVIDSSSYGFGKPAIMWW